METRRASGFQVSARCLTFGYRSLGSTRAASVNGDAPAVAEGAGKGGAPEGATNVGSVRPRPSNARAVAPTNRIPAAEAGTSQRGWVFARRGAGREGRALGCTESGAGTASDFAGSVLAPQNGQRATPLAKDAPQRAHVADPGIAIATNANGLLGYLEVFEDLPDTEATL